MPEVESGILGQRGGPKSVGLGADGAQRGDLVPTDPLVQVAERELHGRTFFGALTDAGDFATAGHEEQCLRI